MKFINTYLCERDAKRFNLFTGQATNELTCGLIFSLVLSAVGTAVMVQIFGLGPGYGSGF